MADDRGRSSPDVALDGSIKGTETTIQSEDDAPADSGNSGITRRKAGYGVMALLLGGGAVGVQQGYIGTTSTVSDGVSAIADGSAGDADSAAADLLGFDWRPEPARKAAHKAVNKLREANDRPQLAWDSELVTIAQQYAERMAEEGFFSHRSPDGKTFEQRYAAAGYSCRINIGGGRYVNGGENLAQAYWRREFTGPDGRTEYYDEPEQVGRGVVKQWETSDTHREHMLEPYWRGEGIGIAKADDETIYAVQNFC